MPWSEWITSAPSPRNAIYVRGQAGMEFDVEGFALDEIIPELRDKMRAEVPDISYADLFFAQQLTSVAETLEAGGEIFAPTGPETHQIHGTLGQRDWWVSTIEAYAPFGGLANLRDWAPDELDALEYGVDYGPRPDRDESEDLDAFIQYMDGVDSTRTGWEGYGVIEFWASDPPDEPVAGEFRLEMWTPPVLPEEMPGPIDSLPWSYSDPVTGSPVGGTFLGGWNGVESDTPDEDPIVFSSSIPDEEEFAIVLLTAPFPLEDGPAGGYPPGTVWGRHQAVNSPSVVVNALIQYPPWRYWIPGRLPLRQRQRDDSLALGSPRQGKKTSRQGSIRQRGYL